MSWQTPGGDPPPDPAAPTPSDPVTPPPQPPVSDPTLGSPPPAAPTPGLISAAPVGWVGPDAATPTSSQAGGPEVAWAPPAPTAAVTMGEGLVVAGVFSRVVAYVIDLAFLATTYFVVLSALGGYGARMTAGSLAVSIFLLAVDAIYFIALWRSSWHATVGMRLMGIRVLRSVDGGTLSFNAAAIRWVAIVGITTLLSFLPVLGAFATLLWVAALLLTTATQPIRQGLHDRWAGSVVLQPAPGGSGAAVIGCLVLIGLMLALPTALLFLWSDQIRDILSQVGNSI